MPWSTPFDEPIDLRGGRKLTTLQHAADYIMELPEDVQQQDRDQHRGKHPPGILLAVGYDLRAPGPKQKLLHGARC